MAAIVSVVIGLIKEGFPGGLVDGISIAIALIIITVVSSVNNYISEGKLAIMIVLSNLKPPATVTRNSIEQMISHTNLVVGDIYLVKAG